MRAVIQRVSNAEVTVGHESVGKIQKGLVILLGIGKDDNKRDCEYLADKVVNLRIFADGQDKMNLSLLHTGGSALIISQFTLFGDCRKGRRPSYNDAAAPKDAEILYEYFIDKVRETGITIATGRFQAMMKISLVNDGPVTVLLDSRKNF